MPRAAACTEAAMTAGAAKKKQDHRLPHRLCSGRLQGSFQPRTALLTAAGIASRRAPPDC